MKRRLQHPRGFTLIEALAAIMVMTIVIPVLLQGFNIAGDMAGITRQTADATMLAQSTLDELITANAWQTSNGPGQQQIGPTNYDVEVSVDQWDNEIDISQLTVKIHWTHKGEREVALTTLVYVPDVTANPNVPTATGVLP